MRRLLLLLLLAFPAFGKSLHWSAIDVDARVDRDGNLHVVEKQRIVFDGDWNGGERNFALRPRQGLELHSMKRIAGTTEIPMTRGDLSLVDHWEMKSRDVVRWRSRMPEDPPFGNQEITYVLDFTYSNVLVDEGDHHYRLSHDFGMPQRQGTIERLSVYVAFDPVWTASPVSFERTEVQPGESVVVNRELTYSGAGDPAGVFKPMPGFVPVAAVLLFAAGALFLVFRFIGEERAVGRFAPVVARFENEQELLSMPAEVAGAMWDGSIGAPEVAAVLARMTQEGKLSSTPMGKTLHLKLLVDRNTLHGHERALVDALFFIAGLEATDTDAIRKHYESSGFDPSSKIQPGIEEQLALLPGWGVKVKRFSGKTDALLILGATALLGLSALPGDTNILAAVAGFFLVLFFSAVGAAIAAFSSKAIASFGWSFAGPVITMLFAGGPILIFSFFARTLGLSAPVLFALALYTLAWLKLVLDLLRIHDSPEKIAFRKRIAGARLYFIEQLRLPQPALRDEWFPYVLAFGLGSNVDRWFRGYGGASDGTSHSYSTSTGSSSSSFSSSSSGSSPSWTGGGGAYGGAGATGSWAIAAGAMAAGVSAPSSSSSSSGGGGGGGGSSSGGGGGGGW
jgi:predicted membrane protein DUF2207